MQGDRRAQFELYQQYSKAMFNICLRMLGDRDEAEDVLQISFVDAFRNLKSYRSEATIGSWIKRIVINNCITTLKRRKVYLESIEDNHLQIADEGGIVESDEDNLTIERIKNAMEEYSGKLKEGENAIGEVMEQLTSTCNIVSKQR